MSTSSEMADMSRADLEARIEALEYGMYQLEHRLEEDSEEWEVVQDAIAPGYVALNQAPPAEDENDFERIDALDIDDVSEEDLHALA